MNAQAWAVIVGALITALLAGSGFIVAMLKLRPETRNVEADTAATVVTTAEGVMKRLESEVLRLSAHVDAITEAHERDMARLRVRVSALHAHVDQLERIMREAGLTPPPRPDTTP